MGELCRSLAPRKVGEANGGEGENLGEKRVEFSKKYKRDTNVRSMNIFA